MMDAGLETFGRIILVSYRLPFKVHRGKVVRNAGGLISAILALTRSERRSDHPLAGKQIIWVGRGEDTPEEWAQAVGDTGPFKLEPVYLPARVDCEYYAGFCNDLIWPLFHYFPSLAVFDPAYLEAYKEANDLFLQQIAKIIKPTDIIWVHDYHLFLLPGMIRRHFPWAKIGFFLHIPFPSYEIFKLLPRLWRKELLEGMLGADLVGFHTYDYTQYFLRAVGRTLGLEVGHNIVTVEDRLVRADTFPISIDYDYFRNALNDQLVARERHRLARILGGRKLIFSIDRLDYTKGLLERLLGIEAFLQAYPRWHKKVVFNLVIIPSRETVARYQQIRREIEATIGRINGRYGSLEWRPIVYEYRTLSFAEMVALYDVSDVGLITPLRDGMNLVAKEYIACQGSKAGVLILSEMAGAAVELNEAIVINPIDRAEVAQAIAKALEMPQAERYERLKRMQYRIKRYDVFAWARDFFDTMSRMEQQQQMYRIRLADRSVFAEVAKHYQKANSSILFMDYDGTLVPFSTFPEQALPDDVILYWLRQLASDPRNTVVIVSGRPVTFLDNWFGSLRVILVAEHGAMVKLPAQEWVAKSKPDGDWQDRVLAVLERYADRCSGSLVEKKQYSVAWHYRAAESEIALERAQELLDELRQLVLQDSRIQIMEGHKVIEVKRAGFNKGSVVKEILSSGQYDFALAIGDDRTDEDMFAALPAEAFTFRIGMVTSLARYNLKDQKQVGRLLEYLTHGGR